MSHITTYVPSPLVLLKDYPEVPVPLQDIKSGVHKPNPALKLSDALPFHSYNFWLVLQSWLLTTASIQPSCYPKPASFSRTTLLPAKKAFPDEGQNCIVFLKQYFHS